MENLTSEDDYSFNTPESRNLLLVEDDVLFAKSVMYLLKSCGYSSDNITTVSSLEQLNALGNSLVFDALLIDLNLTDSSGEQTFHHVRKLYPAAPLIILSGMEDIELSIRLVQLGGQDYIYKSEISASLLSKCIEFAVERRIYNAKIESSEKRYRNIFESSPLPIMILDSCLQISSCNHACLDIYGLNSFDQLVETNFNTLNYNSEIWTIPAHLKSFSKPLVQTKASGEIIYIEMVGNKMPDEIGSGTATYVCLLKDRTDEILFQKNKLKIINDVQEKEKNHIAMELHDSVSQNMVLLNLWVHSLNVHEDSVLQKENIQGVIQSTITEIRNISYNLSPPELQQGIVAAIQTLVKRLQRIHQIKFIFNFPKDFHESQLTNLDILNIYRIIQEFINNSIKHSQCDTITIELYLTENGKTELMLKDNGIGFDESLISNGLGLQNIDQRIRNGGLRGAISSRQNEGTRLTMILEPEILFNTPLTMP
jgi:PAS domain S-box-containing protein